MELKGIVVFQLSNRGSKSENIFPYLYVEKAKFIKLFMEGDNPFENNDLDIYDGKRVKVEGELNEYNVFIIKEIEEISDNEQDIILCDDKTNN